MNTLSNLIQSEIADFFTGFGGPGEPDIQNGEAQRQLTDRVLDLLRKEREAAVPVGFIHSFTPFTFGKSSGAIFKEETRHYYKPVYAAPPAQPVAVPVRYMNRFTGACFTLDQQPDAATDTAVYVPLFDIAQPFAVPDIGQIRVGRLPTMNQDDYPGLGDWWVQLRIDEDSEEILARVYGDTPQEANSRAEALACRAAMDAATISNSADIAIDELGHVTTPPAANHNLFVQGVIDDGENCAYADDDEAHYFTVYRRNADGTADALMDFTNRVNALWAISLVKKLNKLPESNS